MVSRSSLLGAAVLSCAFALPLPANASDQVLFQVSLQNTATSTGWVSCGSFWIGPDDVSVNGVSGHTHYDRIEFRPVRPLALGSASGMDYDMLVVRISRGDAEVVVTGEGELEPLGGGELGFVFDAPLTVADEDAINAIMGW